MMNPGCIGIRILCTLLACGILAFSLTACSGNAKESQQPERDTTQDTAQTETDTTSIRNQRTATEEQGTVAEKQGTVTGNQTTQDVTNKQEPLSIEKGYYVYKNEFSSGYEYLGFCEYKNTSSEDVVVNSIEFRFLDKDGVIVGSSDYPDYSLTHLKSGASGYALDTFASFNSSISSPEEIVKVDVLIDYDKAEEKDTTSLEVGEVEMTNDYASNVSGFAGTTVVTNPYDNDVEYYALLAGMYDAEGKLVGVMNMAFFDGIPAKSKARCTASWLPDSREIPNQVASLKANARVTSFVAQS